MHNSTKNQPPSMVFTWQIEAMVHSQVIGSLRDWAQTYIAICCPHAIHKSTKVNGRWCWWYHMQLICVIHLYIPVPSHIICFQMIWLFSLQRLPNSAAHKPFQGLWLLLDDSHYITGKKKLLHSWYWIKLNFLRRCIVDKYFDTVTEVPIMRINHIYVHIFL